MSATRALAASAAPDGAHASPRSGAAAVTGANHLLVRDLIRKPDATFRDHASPAMLIMNGPGRLKCTPGMSVNIPALAGQAYWRGGNQPHCFGCPQCSCCEKPPGDSSDCCSRSRRAEGETHKRAVQGPGRNERDPDTEGMPPDSENTRSVARLKKNRPPSADYQQKKKQRGKDEKNQGVSVLARRKPTA